MKKSIFTYDKRPDCAYCRFSGEGEPPACEKGSTKQPCEAFEYDVFKRKPRQSLKLGSFDAGEFEI